MLRTSVRRHLSSASASSYSIGPGCRLAPVLCGPMSEKPYTRAELAEAADGRWPDRGIKCECCGTFVPEFEDFPDAARSRVLALIREERHMLAQAELMAATGAPVRFAKIWVIHGGQGRPRFPGPPCPHCGAPLPSSRSKQCLTCHADWH